MRNIIAYTNNFECNSLEKKTIFFGCFSLLSKYPGRLITEMHNI
jgi:hypothetical protein